MCNYQVLYHNNEEGYVIHCLACNHIQLGFGNIAMTFSKNEFYRFLQCMNGIHDELKQDEKNSFLKNIRMPTPCEGMMFLLSPKELSQLVRMLDVAETELRSTELIGLFANH